MPRLLADTVSTCWTSEAWERKDSGSERGGRVNVRMYSSRREIVDRDGPMARLSVRVPHAIYRRVKIRCAQRQMQMRYFLAAALGEALERRRRNHG